MVIRQKVNKNTEASLSENDFVIVFDERILIFAKENTFSDYQKYEVTDERWSDLSQN